VPTETATPSRHGLTVRAVLIAIVLTWLSGYWIRQSEIIALACQGTEAVPSIPGVGALVVLLLVNPLLRRSRRIEPLSVSEIITVFLFVTVASFMFACGVGRFLIACISAPFYYSSPAAPLEELARWIPKWMSPQDATIHRWLYESSPTGHVPWQAWATPILTWTGFYVLFAGVLFSLMVLFSEPWVEQERLVFPLVRLPLQMVDPNYSAVPFFKCRATWIGILLALLLNAYSMVQGVFFGGPSGSMKFDLVKALTGAPWNAIKPLELYLRPELIGLGYLISTELSFSIWFFTILNKLVAVAFSAGGYRVSGVPFTAEQGTGAYVVLAAILFWKARHSFGDAARAWLGFQARKQEATLTMKLALAGAVLGFIGLIVFCVAAGMAPWLAITYFLVLIAMSVVYGRLRAEIGVPLIWAFPYGLAHKSIRYFIGSKLWVGPGPQYRSATIYTMFIFLSRGFFPSISGYGIEGLTLGENGGVKKGSTFLLLLGAVALGALASWWFHLVPYYDKGAVGLRGGIWGSGHAQTEFAGLWKAIQMPQQPDNPRIVATLSGGVFIGLLSFLRAKIFGSPFHPLGYAVSCSFGPILWGPFLIVWVLKSIILRYGGHQAYLTALPGFLGFALGHFIVAGAIWGSLGAALGGPFLRYGVWFG
jgi:hypothetical protein